VSSSERNPGTSARSSLAFAAWCSLGASVACAGETLDAPLDTRAADIRNGTSSADERVVKVLKPGLLCTGTLIRNDVVLTAYHCIQGAAVGDLEVRSVNGESSGVRATIRQPDTNGYAMDVAMLRLEVPLLVDGSYVSHRQLLYREDMAPLIGDSVTCIGYGIATCGANDSGSQREGISIVGGVGAWRDISMILGPDDQVPAAGDSGGSCFTAGNRITHVNRTATCQPNGGGGSGDYTRGVRADRIGPWLDRVVASWSHIVTYDSLVIQVPALN
jgi:hypothetical protein